MATQRRLWVLLIVAVVGWLSPLAAAPVEGWLGWRGPHGNGVSDESGLPDRIEVNSDVLRWSVPLPGRGAPVVAGNRVYVGGYEGEGADLQEVLVCYDTETGQRLWDARFNDFLSDIVYDRYSIGAPAIDAETGNVYFYTSPGILAAFTAEGRELWRHSLMEAFGRLTFPNGRTGSPAVEGELVIVHGITANWGKDGPARDRFYAFDKRSGGLVWSSTPGTAPQDSSFSTPVFGWLQGRRVFYAGTGCGNIVCVNALTGEPLSRFQLARGGINSSPLLLADGSVIAIHDNENLDSSETGRMVRVDMAALPEPGKGPVALAPERERWRNPLGIFTSSPVYAAGLVYQFNTTGNLACVDAETGAILWLEKLSYTQLHASPAWADGKLYAPMKDGSFYVIRPSREKAEILSKTQLEGECLGAPAIWRGRIYLHTTARLYCFGSAEPAPAPSYVWQTTYPAPGPATAVQVIPSDVVLTPGRQVPLTLRTIDANGFPVTPVAPGDASWEAFVPPGAMVKSTLNAAIGVDGVLTAGPEQRDSAGMFRVAFGGLTGYLRGRLVRNLPIGEDFESFSLTPGGSENLPFAYPPLPWIGARFKWEVRQLDGSNVLVKTLDRVLFQRALTFVGTEDMSNYTLTADIRSEGNRRLISDVGVINQRYTVALLGNWQKLEVHSNHDRIKYAVPFAWQPNAWYTLKTRVDIAADGSGIVRARVWPRGTPEPADWTLEMPHRHAHRTGAPGLYGFSLQSKMRVFVDNLAITPND